MRALADRPPEWTKRRPATTVLSTPRISPPSARDRDPSWKPGDKWPSQFRNAVRVSTVEAAVLQGFRPDYPWQGSRTRCFLQIGNAVCPPVASLVVAAISLQSVDRKESKR
jgi:DNA (cytosine-5)-methyltransferase 1